MSQASRILVVDDQRDLVDLVRRKLEQEGFEVLVAFDGRAGLEAARSHRPDLIVLDLTLPEIDGLEVCRRLREGPGAERIPVIVLSARASESDRVNGLEIGADDYLIKPFSPRELLARIRAVLRRASVPQSAQPLLKAGDLEFDFVQHRVTCRSEPLALTPTEFRVLAAMATHPGRTFSREELTAAALRRSAGNADRAIDVHINKIREVLGPAAGQIETVRGVGYRFRRII